MLLLQHAAGVVSTVTTAIVVAAVVSPVRAAVKAEQVSKSAAALVVNQLVVSEGAA